MPDRARVSVCRLIDERLDVASGRFPAPPPLASFSMGARSAINGIEQLKRSERTTARRENFIFDLDDDASILEMSAISSPSFLANIPRHEDDDGDDA